MESSNLRKFSPILVLSFVLLSTMVWSRKAVMEGFPASNNTILISTPTATVTIANLVVTNDGAILGNVTYHGLKTNAQISALTCAGGAGACEATSSDNGDVYRSTGTLTGQYRNTRTGTGP